MARRKRGLQSQVWFAKRDAKKRGLRWSIADKRAMKLMLQPCHWCAAPPNPYNGLDRPSNEPFYHASNVVPCCWRCNKAKGAMSATEFIRWCAAVVSRRFGLVRDGGDLITMFP